jgi:aromatic-L-amino-acid decarboxylase
MSASLRLEHERLGRLAVEMITEYAETLDTRPLISAATPQQLAALFDEPLPVAGTSGEELLERFREDILPHSMTVSSPRYYGQFNPTPLAVSVWGDALASTLNQNGAIWRNSPAANVIADRVLRWLCQLIGYTPAAYGTITSGGSEANLVALKCARDAVHERIRDRGLRAAPGELTVYASDQCHYSFIKCLDILGLGRDQLRRLPTDESFHISRPDLRQALADDQANGYLPCAIVGAAGATSTGIIDPLHELAEIAAETGCWFHVDAAYGGALAFAPKYRERLRGIERADSVTLDPHKWMFVPFACGATLVRDGAHILRDAFDWTPEYLTEQRDYTGGAEQDYDLFRYGQLGTHRFNALKLWLALKHLGTRGYSEITERQVKLAEYLADLLDDTRGFVRVGAVETAVVCFRYLPDEAQEWDARAQDHLQQRLQQRVERSGQAFFASTILHGRRALRININSYLTEKRHLEDLLHLLQKEGTMALAEGG